MGYPTAAAQTNHACMRLSSLPTSSGIPSEEREHNIMPQKDYAITEPVTSAADVDPLTIVPSTFEQVSRKVASIQTMSTPESSETVSDEHLLYQNSQGQICITKSLSTNTNQMSLAVTEFPIVEGCSPSEQNPTNAPSAFKEPVSQIEIGAINKHSSTAAQGRVTEGVLVRDVGAFDVCSLTKATQSILSVSTPEYICLTRTNKQDSNSSSVTSEMISGLVIDVFGTDENLPNGAQGKANVTIFDDTVTKKQVSKLNKVTAEPISASVIEAFTTDLLLPTTAHVKGITLAAKESEKTASVSTSEVLKTTNEFKTTESVHIDVSNHGSETIGSLSVAENPLLNVTLATSLPQQMTKEPQSVSVLECSGPDTHSSVAAQEVFAAVETTQNRNVCTGMRKNYISINNSINKRPQRA